MGKSMKELRQLAEDDLRKRLEELKADLLKKRAEARLGTLKDTSSLRNIRKEISRINLLLWEKKRTNEKKAPRPS
ncbi:50S ribosomal protein L29 [Metallosphaera yellowstonensis]|nr:50S ribosomal protein L29 [Metallosphaera yellowstonensis]